MSTHGSPTTRRFVRTAWILLAFQLLAAIGAGAAAVWAFTAVRNLVNDRTMLQARVTELEAAAQNRTAPAEPQPQPVTEPVAAPTPAPEATPTPAPVTPAPPSRQLPVRTPPVRQPVVQAPVYTPPETPPAYNPPVYTPPVQPPPRTDDKPPQTDDTPPPRPQRPRIRVNVPGLITDIVNNRPRGTRTPNTNPTNPVRTPGTTTPNNSRPPLTNVPTTGQAQPPRTTNATPIRRRVRIPTTTSPQQPVVN